VRCQQEAHTHAEKATDSTVELGPQRVGKRRGDEGDSVGADKRGIVHTVVATNARTADITQLPALLHGQKREIFGDQAYWKADRQAFEAQRRALPGQSTSHAQAAERTLAPDQSRALADPGVWRTRVSGHQTAQRQLFLPPGDNYFCR
jgi:hypothetical protein